MADTPFPSIQQTFVDEAGIITSPWRALLAALWTRTGSSGGGTVFTPPLALALGGTAAASGSAALTSLGALDQNLSRIAAVTGGSANSQTATISPAIDGYHDFQRFFLQNGVGTNTGSLQLNVNTKGARTVTDVYGNALKGGEFPLGALAEFAAFGSSFILLQTAQWLGTNFLWYQAVSAASQNLDFDPLPTGFTKHKFSLIDLVPGTDNIDLEALLKISGAFLTATYNGVYWTGTDTPAGPTAAAQNTAAIKLATGQGNASGEYCSGEAYILNPDNTTKNKKLQYDTDYTDSAGLDSARRGWGGNTVSNAAVTAVRFRVASGLWGSGAVLLESTRGQP